MVRRLGWLLILLAGCSPEPVRPAPRSARAPSRVAIPDAPLRVAVVSDLNGSWGDTDYGPPVHEAVARVVVRRPDLVLTTGDMVAGQHRGLDYAAMWAAFHAAVTEPLDGASIPFAPAPGNHDASGYPAFEAERAAYAEAWAARRPDVTMVDAAQFPFRYAFRMGPALFVALDATTVGPLAEAQMRWLDATLAATDAPVKVVFGHVPLHPFTVGREAEHIGDAALEALLRRHDVDLFLSGHHHAYYPGRRGPLRLVSMACLGGGPRPLIGTRHRSDRAIVTLEITADGVRELEGWRGDRFDERIARDALPEAVGTGAQRVLRDDRLGPGGW